MVQHEVAGMFQIPHLNPHALCSLPPKKYGYTDRRPLEHATNRGGEKSGSAPSPVHYRHTLQVAFCRGSMQAISSFKAPLMPSTLSSGGSIHDAYAVPFRMACFFNHIFT